MKKILELILKIARRIFPKSRFANIVYLIIGYFLANWTDLEELLNSVIELLNQ